MKAKGIQVLAQEERQLTEDEAREFYSHLKDEVSDWVQLPVSAQLFYASNVWNEN